MSISTPKIGTTGYKLNPEKLASARRELLPYLFSCFYFTEEFEYFDLVKPYLDIPEPPKTLDEISQELDEKIDALIKTTKEKFECSNYFAGKRYNEKFDEKVVISQNGESNCNKSSYSFVAMMDWFDVMLEEKLLDEIKEQKRQELIARLTDEEKKLLNLK